jgi:hypothetical protein
MGLLARWPVRRKVAQGFMLEKMRLFGKLPRRHGRLRLLAPEHVEQQRIEQERDCGLPQAFS